MSTTVTPPPKKVNRIGLEVLSYKGAQDHAVRRLRPQRHLGAHHRVLLRDGRAARGGWPSSPASAARRNRRPTFWASAHGFNAVHGRAPAVATGAMLANRNLLGLTVTGDGDTASIGLGQFMHMLRRNLPLIYIIENNGVYGLTKGQFSATADLGSKLKTGVVNDLPPIDCCLLGIELGATLVARSFSGDKRQLQAHPQGRHRAQGAFRHRRHLALRDLQRPRRLHQELRLHEGPRRAAARAGLRAGLRGHLRRDRGGRGARGDHARRLAARAEEAGPRLRSHRQDAGRPDAARGRGERPGAHRPPLRRYRPPDASSTC